MMDASTRLYRRLAEIPEDPEDPESLDDLIVCAFGAFERYFVCWKTKGGVYKQDGNDLPPALHDWLYPTDGTTRDFASLQVVFGRGEEYFASDHHGKIEYKELEVRKSAENEENIDRVALRRSRPASFLRPLSKTSVRPESFSTEPLASRQSSISSQRDSWPSSLISSKTNSDASILSRLNSRPLSMISAHTRAQSSLGSQWAPGYQATTEHTLQTESTESKSTQPGKTPVRKDSVNHDPHDTDAETSSLVYTDDAPTRLQTPSTSHAILPPPTLTSPTKYTPLYPCHCHTKAPPKPQPTYTNSSAQTDPTSPINSSHTTPSDKQTQTPVTPNWNPLAANSSIPYFDNPDYQLGDSLRFGYYNCYNAYAPLS